AATHPSKMTTCRSTKLRHTYSLALVALTSILLVGCTPAASDEPEVKVFDLTGKAINPLRQTDAAAQVFLFARTDCPISNRYAPEIRRLHKEFNPQGVTFYLVYPDPAESAANIQQHIEDYEYPFTGLRDPSHRLVKCAGATVTPEAAVFSKQGKLLYCGRIDDWYADFGKARPEPTQRDLHTALTAALAGKAVPPPTGKAIGCFITDLTPQSSP
ncbi:MAG TPA: redoxin domain-containing protein, partial [Pirellulales bacterium]|nr:redoxin domain-containing protein [Pirellulales bacterium]